MPMPWGAVGITSFTQTASGPLKYEVSVAWRRASRLSCCLPEVASAKPGSSNTTHESLAISLKLIEISGRSVFTDLATTLGPPPKVIWLRRWTQPTADAERVLRREAIRITEFVDDPELGVLVLDRD